MDSPNKIVDNRSPEFAKRTTVGEALHQARLINTLVDPEQRADRLNILNHLVEQSLGGFTHITSGKFYEVSPFGLMESDTSEPSETITGSREGFFDLKGYIEADTIDEVSIACAKLYLGQGKFKTMYTSGTFERYLFFPVTEIETIESVDEFVVLYGITSRPDYQVESNSDVFKSLESHIIKMREKFTGKSIIDPRVSENIEFLAYSPDNKNELYELRRQIISVNAEFGIIQIDNESDESVHVVVNDFSFTGYYMGVTGFQGKKGHYKSHFVFEVYDTEDYPSIGVRTERVSPIIFVPISDSVGLDISDLENS